MIYSRNPDVGDSSAKLSARPSTISTGGSAFDTINGILAPAPTEINEEPTREATLLRETRFDVVNAARRVELAFAMNIENLQATMLKTNDFSGLMNSELGNWRNRTTNNFCNVSKRVSLHMEKLPDMGGNIQHTLKEAKEIMETGLLKTVKGITEGINKIANGIGAIQATFGLGNPIHAPTGEYLSKFGAAPYMKMADTKTTGIDSLKFDFKFGAAGLFSGEEEVVKPILALMNPFSLRGGHNITGPYPTEGYMKAVSAAAFLGSLRGVASAFSGVGFSAEGILQGGINLANNLTNALFNATDAAALASANRSSYLIVQLGGALSGPYAVGNIKWSFDFTDVDEHGFPTSGELTFGGLRPIMLITGADYIAQWNLAQEGMDTAPEGNSVWANSMADNPSEEDINSAAKASLKGLKDSGGSRTLEKTAGDKNSKSPAIGEFDMDEESATTPKA